MAFARTSVVVTRRCTFRGYPCTSKRNPLVQSRTMLSSSLLAACRSLVRSAQTIKAQRAKSS